MCLTFQMKLKHKQKLATTAVTWRDLLLNMEAGTARVVESTILYDHVLFVGRKCHVYTKLTILLCHSWQFASLSSSCICHPALFLHLTLFWRLLCQFPCSVLTPPPPPTHTHTHTHTHRCTHMLSLFLSLSLSLLTNSAREYHWFWNQTCAFFCQNSTVWLDSVGLYQEWIFIVSSAGLNHCMRQPNW